MQNLNDIEFHELATILWIHCNKIKLVFILWTSTASSHYFFYNEALTEKVWNTEDYAHPNISCPIQFVMRRSAFAPAVRGQMAEEFAVRLESLYSKAPNLEARAHLLLVCYFWC